MTWPGTVRYWVKTSGTTAGDKVIPVTREALPSAPARGLGRSAPWRPGGSAASPCWAGPLLFLGGSTTLTRLGEDGWLGDLSGLVVRDLPPVIAGRYSPGPAIAGIADWETRLDGDGGRRVGARTCACSRACRRGP